MGRARLVIPRAREPQIRPRLSVIRTERQAYAAMSQTFVRPSPTLSGARGGGRVGLGPLTWFSLAGGLCVCLYVLWMLDKLLQVIERG